MRKELKRCQNQDAEMLEPSVKDFKVTIIKMLQ